MSNLIKELSLSITGPSDIPNIRLLVSEIRPLWDLSSLKIKIFNEGTSNILFAVCMGAELAPETCVLVRIFGAQTELYIDRQHEALYLLILHKLGFAGEVFAKFTNGISYEYTPGFVPSYDFLLEPKNYKMVAKKMAHLHTLPIRETVKRFLSDDEFPLNEEPCVLKHIHRYIELLPSDDFSQRNSTAVQRAKDDYEQKRTYPSEYPSRTDLLQEARFLEKLLKGAKSPVAFCHNDLLLGNMIISPSQDSVSFIDFEYCGYNHTAYDIADHFAEFAGNRDIDFSRYPSEAMKRDWLRTYLSTLKGITSSSSLSLEQGDSSLILQCVTDEEIDDWMQEVRLFTMACHLLWGIWSMVQSVRSNIDFDFKAYALAKLGEYFRCKSLL